jgi:hypothetical protein
MQVSHESLLNVWDKIWKDKHGDVVIWQTPNAFLIGWAVLTVLCLFTSGKLSDYFGWAGDISLVIWSLLEIFKGVNYFRRILGVIVLAFAIASFIKTF